MKVKINPAQYLVDKFARVEVLDSHPSIKFLLRKTKQHIGWTKPTHDAKEIILIERKR
jgi:hypothetical protein